MNQQLKQYEKKQDQKSQRSAVFIKGQIRELKQKYPHVVEDIESKKVKKIKAGQPIEQVAQQFDPVLVVGRRMTLPHRNSYDREEIMAEQRDQVGKMPSSNDVNDVEYLDVVVRNL